MKSLVFLVYALLITGCSYQHAKSVDERIEDCKEGYLLALRSGKRDLTECVIFQIIVKKMNGYFEDTEQLETELSHLVLVGNDESTRKKAEFALRFLNSMSNLDIANIRSLYHDENRLYHLLEENLKADAPEYTQIK
jgi:hypothetical protein